MMQHPMVLFGKDEWLLMSNKECAYARYLPDEVVRSENCPVAAVPQAAAKRVNHRYYLDVLPEGAAAEDVYHKGDTHWHHLGALLAFNATMRAIGLPESEDGEFIRVDSYIDGDLSIKIGERIASVKLSPAASKHRLIDNNAVNNIGQRRIYENADKLLPRAVLFRDSFSSHQLDMFASRFSRIVYLWQPISIMGSWRRNPPILSLANRLNGFLLNAPMTGAARPIRTTNLAS